MYDIYNLHCKESSVMCAEYELFRIALPYALKFSRDETFAVFAVRKTTANSLIREYFEQVLQNRKKMDAKKCPCSVVAFVLDRKYKYG